MKTSRLLPILFSFLLAACADHSAQADPKPPLRVGDKAPLVEGKDQEDKKWKLEDEIAKYIVLLYFYPKDNTPGCTSEACGLRDKLGDLSADGVKVIGVSFDTVESHKSFVFKYDLNFPLVSDPDGKIADAYGARMGSSKKMDRRISFLIGWDGKIAHITDSPKADVHLTEMQKAVKAISPKSP